jgi:Holliday junction resolvase RusA-like endonuclease
MKTLVFIVPGRPIVQERPIVLRRGWAIDPPRSKKEKKRIALIALEAQRKHGLSILAGSIHISMGFYGLRPNADISNAVKLVEDALNKVVYLDDKQICKLTAERFRQFSGEPRTEVHLVELAPELPAQPELLDLDSDAQAA